MNYFRRCSFYIKLRLQLINYVINSNFFNIVKVNIQIIVESSLVHTYLDHKANINPIYISV